MFGLLRSARESLGRWRFARRLRERHPGLRLGPGVDVRSPERLSLGRDVFIDAGAVLHCGGMSWSPGGGISLGDNVYVGPNAVLFGAGGIEIGSDVLISPGVVITSHQHTFASSDRPMREQPVAFATVVIEQDVWIGANAVILPGVRLGRGCVVGAGAIVTHDVVGRGIAVGVPARVTRQRP
jgi:galactoside O-acetyltransferase